MSATGIYLDNAATSFPKPPAVYDALVDYSRRVGASAGRGAYAEAREAGRILDDCRQALADLIGAPRTERVIFTLNCTDALNLGLKGMLRRGDHVVTTWMDHNSILRPLHHLEATGEIEVTRVRANDEGLVDPAALAAAIGPRTRLVATLHASNVSGSLQPIADFGAVCRKAGVPLLVDAAQTIGAMPVDVEASGIDLLAFPGHKGLMGPLGTGALWMSDRVDPATVREGGTGSRSELAVQPDLLPDRYEAGSHNLLGIAGLLASVRYVTEVGLDAIAAHKRDLTERFIEGIAGVPGIRLHGPPSTEDRVAVFSLTFEGKDCDAMGETLDREYGLKVRSGLHCAPLAHQTLGTHETGTVRLSPGYFTTGDDIDRTVAAVRELAAKPA